MEKIYAVILAAGASTRLGFNKLTLKIDGQPVIQRALNPFLSNSIDKVFVVTGFKGEQLRETLGGVLVSRPFDALCEEGQTSSLIFVENPDYRSGMSASVRVALPCLADAKGVFFHLGDKPFIKKETIHSMLHAYLNTGAHIVVPTHEGKRGHPVLINVDRYREEMRRLRGDKGLREVIEKHPEDVVSIEGDEGNLFDIDTIEAIEYLKGMGYEVEED